MTKYNAFLFLFSRHQNYYAHQAQFLDYLSRNRHSGLADFCSFVDSFYPHFSDELMKHEKFHQLITSGEGLSYVIYGEELYPKEFYLLIDPPVIFSYSGSPCWVNTSKLTVVGSRNPTEKSIHWMSSEIQKFINFSDWVTVSGGAIGVDQWTHQMSVRAKKRTIAILPAGLERLYPSNMLKLSVEIIKNGGCVVSEFYPFEDVKKYHFKFRNRLIAALNQKCLVIEAKEKSGSLITGHFVVEMGKDLYVLPGHPLDPNFKGSHELLKTGGVVFTSYQDFESF